MSDFDFAIIGAGIAGASLAALLSARGSVVLIEAEAHPGYHSTGRSAAFWDECYGGPGVQPLTTASGPFLAAPPADFHDGPLMHPRGALHIGTSEQTPMADNMLAEFAASGVHIEVSDRAAVQELVPGLRAEWTHGLWEPACCDIDVAALHAAYLRQAKRQGAQLYCNSRLSAAAWQNGAWQISAGSLNCSANIIVNAAGAWADEVATIAQIRPLGIQPYRRTIAQLAVSPDVPANLPLVIGLDGSFYFKPDTGGRLWLSPHDETATPACDAAPEELDVAIAIDRLQQVVDWDIKRVEHKWAGLRSFAPDRLPVIGRDSANEAFFWFAGQGGFGIQTAPAAAQLAASLLDEEVAAPQRVDADVYTPARFS
ncbi:NAD(P)/FAD-dependent oxidoreductase [Sphingorhabdus sp.]|uniref:NAD(P)/FAD-dependent oxidoreductase n=1 Tax=Sphingorhabdus sp. TaxID=1902408 RepID=UPI003918B3F5